MFLYQRAILLSDTFPLLIYFFLCYRPMPKKLKRELTPPELTVSASISNAAELTDAFLTAVRCWQLLHSRELLSKGRIYCRIFAIVEIVN